MTLNLCSVDLISEQFFFLEIHLLYPGLVSTMAILCLVALGKLLANRASVRNTLTTLTTTLINTQHHLEFDNAFDQYQLQVARVERVRQILGGQLGTAGTWADKLGTAGTWGHAAGQLPDKESSAQLTQPMLAGTLFFTNVGSIKSLCFNF